MPSLELTPPHFKISLSFLTISLFIDNFLELIPFLKKLQKSNPFFLFKKGRTLCLANTMWKIGLNSAEVARVLNLKFIFTN